MTNTMRKMYITPITELAAVEQQFAIMSASGEKKQTVVTPAELWSGKLN